MMQTKATWQTFWLWFYRLLLRSYPQSYRQAYEEELSEVFGQELETAQSGGGLSVLRLFARELRDLPGAAFMAHLRESSSQRVGVGPGYYLPVGQQSLWGLIAVFTPFVLGIFFALTSTQSNKPGWIQSGLIGGVLLAFILLLLVWMIGLWKAFPTWALPALGVAFFILTYLMDGGTGSIIGFFHLAKFPREFNAQVQVVILRNIVYVLPVLGMLAVLLLLARLVPPLRPFHQRVSRDWSLLSFLLYGALIPPVLMNDAYRYLELYETGALLVLAGGAWQFLKSPSPWRRLGWLLIAGVLSFGVMAFGIYQVLPLQVWAGHSFFGRGWETLNPLLSIPSALIYLSLPALLTFFPQEKPLQDR